MKLSVLDTKEAAAHLGVAPKTLANRRSIGEGPRYMKLGGAVRYRIEDLDAYMAASLVSTTQKIAS